MLDGFTVSACNVLLLSRGNVFVFSREMLPTRVSEI
jgi:hypothetical protein